MADEEVTTAQTRRTTNNNMGLIESLNNEIARLNGVIAATRGEAADWRKKAQSFKKQVGELTTEKDGLAKTLTDKEAEIGQWKVKADAAPGEAGKQIENLQKAIQLRDHKDAFKALYADESLQLNSSVPVEELWALMKYEPSGDAVDAKAIRDQVAKAIESRPYLKAAPKVTEAVAEVAETQPAKPPGPGAARGTTASEPGKFHVTKAQSGDARWMWENRQAIAQAREEGRLQLIE